MLQETELQSFIKGYFEALMFVDVEVINSELTLEDIALSDKNKNIEECRTFFKDNYKVLNSLNKSQAYNFSQAGYDFYLTRNGHGAGFWDRGLGEIGEILTEQSKKYLEVYLQ